MGLLAGVVGGAIKLGTKLFANAKKRKAARKAKKDKKQATKDQKLLASLDAARDAINNPGGIAPGIVGADEVAQSGNVLQMFKNFATGGGGSGPLVTVADERTDYGAPDDNFMGKISAFIKTPVGMLVAAALLYFIAKKMRIIK